MSSNGEYVNARAAALPRATASTHVSAMSAFIHFVPPSACGSLNVEIAPGPKPIAS